jgi:DNA modification methylase
MPSDGNYGKVSGGVSKFDTHLAECLLSWLCPPGGKVMDPFAGGPVRGLIASHLGYAYTGIDLLEPQVQANRDRAAAWSEEGLLGPDPTWVHGDAATVLPGMADTGVDYLLTCPPYHNREKYSQHPDDLSAMRWPAFLAAYRRILAQAVRVLRDDRFATIIISDVRDAKGHLRGLPGLTTDAMLDAGAHLTNEQILVTPTGNLATAMRPPWEACRTTMRRHQLVLTYVKGDRRKAAAAIQAAPVAPAATVPGSRQEPLC